MEAAVSISEGSIGAVLEKLHLLVDECSRIKGVRSQVGFLRSELASIHALLRKVAAMEDPDIQVKAWAREVREMAYDIEDCVDAFTHRLGGGDEPHGQGGIKEFFGKCARFLLALRSRHQFANQIDELKSRLVEVGERWERYKLDDLACGNSGRMVVDPRLSALFADEDQLVGIDGPRDDLAKWMVEGESGLAKHRKVLSRSKIAFLVSELNNMYAFHQKVTMMEDPDVQVKAWAREVRELAYDIEDCIDKFMHSHSLGIKRKRRKTGSIRELFHTCVSFLHSLRSWHQIASKIDELKTRVVAVREQRNSYKLDGLASGTSCSEKIVVDPRLSALFADEACLVGIEGPRDDLVNWLVHGETGLIKHCKVLSIVGFGGLGKTTLANEVYRKIRANFHYHAFVSLSQKPDMKKILKSVLFQLLHEDSFTEVAQTLDEVDLILKLRELLQDKRYLIVIDDVWSMSAWDTIKCAFPENNCCSRIIATTRIIDVAHSCSSSGDGRVYEIEPLNDLDSKRLFFRRIFGTEDCHHHHLQEVSNEILKKCGGLPLAILSISSLLANGPFLKEEWEKVRNSIGFLLDKNHNLEGMKNILSLSYNDLPYHLKTCLLYLSIFPEDFDIERDRLIGRWIAEGFISIGRGQRLQDVAESYFYELINKSMLHPVDIGYDGKARACRIHDMMLELITLKAIEENFITILGSQMALENPYSNIRRLSVQYTGQEIKAELAGKDLCHARSLTAYGQIKYLPRLVEFEVLRVLDLEGCMGLEGYDLNNIDKMFQLRYLSLRSTRILTIPTQIMKLQNLETLDLRETCIMELPDGIVRLRRLLHLLAGSEERGLPNIPNGIGSMTSLQVLSGFNICLSSASAVEEFGNLTNLMELAIGLDSGGSSNNKICEDMLLSSLCRLGSYKLQRLLIRSCHAAPLEFLDLWFPSPYFLQTFRMNTSYYFAKIPKWMTPALTCLACLHINLREVTVEDLCIFGEFPALLFLEVWLDSDPAERLIILGEGFQILREFRLICDCGGAYLAFEGGAMPKVKKLCLPFHVSIAKMYDFYLGIEHLPCLKEVEVEMYHEGPKDLYTMAAAVAIENEANSHPNRPRVIVGPIDLVEGNEESSIMEAN